MKKLIIEHNKAEGLKNFAIHIGRNADVKIRETLKAGTLATDGNTIYIPMVPDELVDRYREIIFAGIWHEAAHIKRTDIEFFMKSIPTINSLQESVFRALEDCRIEYFEEQENSVATEELTALRKWAVNICKENISKEIETGQQIIRALTPAIYFDFFGYKFDFIPEFVQKIIKLIKPDIENFKKIMVPDKSGTNQTLKYAKHIVKKIEELIQEEKQRKEEEKRQKEEEKKDKGKEGEGKEGKGKEKDKEGEGKDKGKKGKDKGKEGEGKEGEDKDKGKKGKDKGKEKKNEKSTKGNKKSDAEEEDDSDGEGDATDPDPSENGKEPDEPNSSSEDDSGSGDEELPRAPKVKGKGKDDDEGDNKDNKEIRIHIVESDDEEGLGEDLEEIKDLESLIEEAKKAGVEDIYLELTNKLSQTIREEIEESTPITQHLVHPEAKSKDIERTAYDGDMVLYNADKEQVEGELIKLRGRFEFYIMGKKRTHFLPDREEGEVDGSSIATARAGNKRVFQELIHAKKMNTAISYLVDLSASMTEYGNRDSSGKRERKIVGARKAVIACSEETARIAIPFEILGFTTSKEWYKNSFTGDGKLYNRFVPVDHVIYKSFKEDFRTTRHRLSTINGICDNCDHEAVIWAANRLLERPEGRKILFVLSDGMPIVAASNSLILQAELKKAVLKIMATGIEVYGIGIYTDAVKHFYPEYTIISGNNNIAESMFGCLKGKLSNGR